MVKIFLDFKDDIVNETSRKMFLVLNKLISKKELKIVDNNEKADICITDNALLDFTWKILEKKHILVQKNIDVTYMECILVEDGFTWMVINTSLGYVLNGLGKNNNTIYSYLMPGIPKSMSRNFSCIIHAKGKLYIIPEQDDVIHIFTIETRTWNEIIIPDCDDIKVLFNTAFLYNNSIYAMPSNYHRIVVINTLNDKIRFVEIDNKNNQYYSYCTKGWLSEDEFVFCSRACKAIMKFNIITEKVSGVCRFDANQNLQFEKHGDTIFLLGLREMDIFGLKSGEMYKVQYQDENSIYNVDADYSDGMFLEGYIYLIPGQSITAAKLSLENGMIMKAGELTNPRWIEKKKAWKYSSVYVNSNIFYAFDTVTKEFVSFDGCVTTRSEVLINTEMIIEEKLNRVIYGNIEDAIFRRE